MYEFKKICEGTCNGDSGDNDDKLVQLGKLMTASHTSLKDFFECSHHQLDELVDLSKPFTHGARLTGAGLVLTNYFYQMEHASYNYNRGIEDKICLRFFKSTTGRGNMRLSYYLPNACVDS